MKGRGRYPVGSFENAYKSGYHIVLSALDKQNAWRRKTTGEVLTINGPSK